MTQLEDKDPMPFGKHKGTAMANVPADYLLYMFEKLDPCSVKDYIRRNTDALKAEIKRQQKFNSR